MASTQEAKGSCETWAGGRAHGRGAGPPRQLAQGRVPGGRDLWDEGEPATDRLRPEEGFQAAGPGSALVHSTQKPHPAREAGCPTLRSDRWS